MGISPHSQAVNDRARRLWAVHEGDGTVRETDQTVADIMRISNHAVAAMRRRKWQAALGDQARVRPMPYDFLIQVEKMNKQDLARHYNAGAQTVKRWTEQVGYKRERRNQHLKKPVPSREELEHAIRTMGLKGARDHFRVGQVLMDRWRKERRLPGRWDKSMWTELGWAERLASERRG